MEGKTHQLEERTETLEEQGITTEGRSRRDMHRTSTSFKINFREFSGEGLGFADVLKGKDVDGIKITSSDVDSSDVEPEQLRAAHHSWISLIKTCNDIAFDIIQGV